MGSFPKHRELDDLLESFSRVRVPGSKPPVREVLALDFETANLQREACSLGIVKTLDSRVVHRENILINPEGWVDEKSTWVHGLTYQDVAGAPPFPNAARKLFSQLSPSTLVIAHNTQFDMDVLHKGLMRYGLVSPSINFLCTYKLSEGIYDDVPSCNLARLSSKVGYSLNHHDSLSDAEGSLAVFKDLELRLRQSGSSVGAFLQANRLIPGSLRGSTLTHMKGRAPRAYSIPLPARSEKTMFSSTNFCFAGDLTHWNKQQATQLVTDRGGEVKSRMSKLVDFFVVGRPNYFTSPTEFATRVAKAKAIAEVSPRSKVLSEEEFAHLLGKSLSQGVSFFE